METNINGKTDVKVELVIHNISLVRFKICTYVSYILCESNSDLQLSNPVWNEEHENCDR